MSKMMEALEERIEALVDEHFAMAEKHGAPVIRDGETEVDLAGSYVDTLVQDEAIGILADEVARRIFARDAVNRIGGKS